MKERYSPGIVKAPGVLLAIVLLVFFFASCSEDDVVSPSPYKDLTLRDHVLANLERACQDRNVERYDEFLDSDYVFFFSETDVANGLVGFEQWSRAREIQATRNFFDPTFSKPGLEPASDIDLALAYAAGEDKWVEVAPTDQDKYPDEVWYVKVVAYSLTVKCGDRDFIVKNVQASFTVRWAKDQTGRELWRIVVWRDDTASTTFTGPDKNARFPSATEPTWGQIKSLYSS